MWNRYAVDKKTENYFEKKTVIACGYQGRIVEVLSSTSVNF